MHRIRIGACVVLSLVATSAAHADWTICNRTADSMRVAVAYVNPRGGFISEGWWTLRACGGCATVVLRSETSDPNNVFFHAESPEGTRIDGNSQFCVGRSPFKMDGKGQCNDTRSFQHAAVNLDRNFTTTINPPNNAGRRCID